METTPVGGPSGKYEGSKSAESAPPPPKGMQVSESWVQWIMKMFPGTDPASAKLYAAQLQANMMSMMSSAIQKDQQRAHEAAQEWKEAIEEQ